MSDVASIDQSTTSCNCFILHEFNEVFAYHVHDTKQIGLPDGELNAKLSEFGLIKLG